MLYELLLYGLVCLAFGSAMGSLTWRWQQYAHAQWQQEAALVLALPHLKPTKLTVGNWRSICPHCHTILSSKALIPILGYIYSRGCCEQCGKTIGRRYPAIEIGTTFTLVPLFFVIHHPLEWALLFVLLSSLVCAFIIDAEDQWIPDECNVLVAVCSTALLDFYGQPLLIHIYTGIVCYGLIALLRILSLWLRKHEAIGLGDVKLIAVLGYWLGPEAINIVLALASLTGILFALQNRTSYSSGISFGPHLIGASILYFYASFLV